MRRRYSGRRSYYFLRDPKHVRDYFHKYALFTRIFHLCADGIWWLISTGFLRLVRAGLRLFGWPLLPRFKINEAQRRLHSFVVGRTGCGKSVLLHNLVRHYLVNDRRPSLVIMDPHGDLANLILRDRALAQRDRLLWVNPDGLEGRHIHFNPFQWTHRREGALARAQVQFAGALEQIVGEAFTPVQRSLVRACIGLMLHRPHCTPLDLLRLLQERHHFDLLHYGQTQLPNPVDRAFFQSEFAKTHYRTTKQALVARLSDVLRDTHVRRFTCQPSSFDLGAALDGGKVIVVGFNPSTQSRDAIRTIGQLLNAALFSHVLGRPENQRPPIHMFVDECQYFVSPTIAEILGESRKFGLYLTLTTQRIERLDPQLQDAILGNVGTLWIGASRHSTAAKLAQETELKAEDIRALPNLSFYRVEGHHSPVKERLRFLGQRHFIAKTAWAKIVRRQAERFYRARLSADEVKARADIAKTANKIWMPSFLTPHTK